MKQVLGALVIFSISSAGFAETTLLACSGSISGGSLFKKVVLVKDSTGLVVKTVDYSNQKDTTKVIASESSPVSTKYVIDSEDDQKTSLVISNGSKQAVMLYEALVDGTNKTTIEFLKCK